MSKIHKNVKEILDGPLCFEINFYVVNKLLLYSTIVKSNFYIHFFKQTNNN